MSKKLTIQKGTEIFQTLNKVVDRLCDTIRSISAETIISITARDWIVKAFN